MKRVFIISVVSLFCVLACRTDLRQSSNDGSEFKFKVKVVKAEIQTFQKFITYKGTVIAWQTANIMPEVSGRIARIHKNVGEEVNAGELLAELDLTALKLQQKQAEAAYNIAAKGYLDAKLNHERMGKLFEQNAVSSFQLEKAQLSLSAAQTQMESGRATLDIVLYNIEKSHMKAPFGGIVSARNFEEGDMVNPMIGAGKPVMVLLDLSKVKLMVGLNAEDIERIEIGKECRVKMNGSEREYSGVVFSKSLAADPGSKTFQVEIAVRNDDKTIRANLFADVWIEIEKQEDVLTLPLQALLKDRYLMVVENGKARRLDVKKGMANEAVFIVEEGLQVGQLVIVEGNYDLQEGQDVIF